MGLRTADAQTKMYEDTLKLIALGKNKMVQDLKMILDKIEPIQNAWKYQIAIFQRFAFLTQLSGQLVCTYELFKVYGWVPGQKYPKTD